MSVENLAIVRRLYEEVWNRRNFEIVNELISPSHALQGPTVFGSSIGPEAYKRQISHLLEAFPDLGQTIVDTIADKDKVVACWTYSGTHKGNFMGVPPTNKRVSVEGITIHHVADGKIMDSYTSWDALGLMKQLGGAVSHYLASSQDRPLHPRRCRAS